MKFYNKTNNYSTQLQQEYQKRLFINELFLWLDHYNRETAFKCIALKVFMTLPCLLLQKPSRNCKAKDHVKKLEERLRVWNESNIEEIILEAKTIQSCFCNFTNSRRTHARR